MTERDIATAEVAFCEVLDAVRQHLPEFVGPGLEYGFRRGFQLGLEHSKRLLSIDDPVIVRALAIAAEVDAISANENRTYAIDMEHAAARIIYSAEEAVERKHGSHA